MKTLWNPHQKQWVVVKDTNAVAKSTERNVNWQMREALTEQFTPDWFVTISSLQYMRIFPSLEVSKNYQTKMKK